MQCKALKECNVVGGEEKGRKGLRRLFLMRRNHAEWTKRIRITLKIYESLKTDHFLGTEKTPKNRPFLVGPFFRDNYV